jgi:hypothetical protein
MINVIKWNREPVGEPIDVSGIEVQIDEQPEVKAEKERVYLSNRRNTQFWSRERGGFDMPPGWEFVPTGDRILSRMLNQEPDALPLHERGYGGYQIKVGFLVASKTLQRLKKEVKRKERYREQEAARRADLVKRLRG